MLFQAAETGNSQTLFDTIIGYATIAVPILVVIAILFAYTQWRSAQNARMTQILLTIAERWECKDMEISRRLINTSSTAKELKHKIDEADKANAEELIPLVRVANFFDTLGVMVVEGLLNSRMAFKLFGSAKNHYYDKYLQIFEDAVTKPYFRYFVELHQIFINEKAALNKPKTKRRRGL